MPHVQSESTDGPTGKIRGVFRPEVAFKEEATKAYCTMISSYCIPADVLCSCFSGRRGNREKKTNRRCTCHTHVVYSPNRPTVRSEKYEFVDRGGAQRVSAYNAVDVLLLLSSYHFVLVLMKAPSTLILDEKGLRSCFVLRSMDKILAIEKKELETLDAEEPK